MWLYHSTPYKHIFLFEVFFYCVIFNHTYSNNIIIKRVTVDKYLWYEGALQVDFLQLFWRNIFTLRKLEKILNSVDYLDASVWQDHTNISRAQPPIFRENFPCLLRILEVARKYAITLIADFSGRIFIGWEIVHIGDILQTYPDANKGPSDMFSSGIKSTRYTTRCRRFGLSIPFVNGHAKTAFEKVDDVLCYWGRACYHASNSAT